jgi:Arc/MetJ-type ribon-helix-helix transcriptional regulator
MTEIASVPLSEDERRFAETLVKEGEYESLSQVVTAGIERLRAEHAERGSAIDGLADELRRMMSSCPLKRSI